MASGDEKSPDYAGSEPKLREVFVDLVIAGVIVVLLVRARLRHLG